MIIQIFVGNGFMAAKKYTNSKYALHNPTVRFACLSSTFHIKYFLGIDTDKKMKFHNFGIAFLSFQDNPKHAIGFGIVQD